MSRGRRYLLLFMTGFGLLTLLLLNGNLSALQAGTAGQAPAVPEDYVYGNWYTAPDAPFAYTRFDAEYSNDTGKVYFLGGRLADGNTDGSVWEYDPVTGTYADTGVDMPVPISNYDIARLVDSGGDEVLMIFGGRPAAGGVVNTVQGYVPSTNSTVDFTATDPLPVFTSPGGVAVHNNIAYIFGGFDAVVVIDDTYFFDINAAPGNRFTAGPPLNDARSYIGAAVVDDYIYAIGGDDFDGAALLPLTIVERLDTNSPVAWDDVGVADLPIPCDEMRAFGFDSDAAYDLAGAIVLAGCGQWPDELPESQIYDVATDTWDMAFNDINVTRRNHAGAFIPSGDGTGGLPGLYIWGGRQADDTNVLVTPEYYQVTPLGDFTLVPQEQFMSGEGTVTFNMGAANRSGGGDTFDLTYSDTQGWTVTGPSSVTVADGDLVAFNVSVEVPPDVPCLVEDVITIDAVGQGDPSLTDTATATVEVLRADCPTGAGGTVTDANTGDPIVGAYVYIATADESTVYDGFTDSNGIYFITEMTPGDYYLAVSAEGYQWSPLPDGWPAGADQITITQTNITVHDVELDAPQMTWSQSSYDLTVQTGQVITAELTITNNGTSDLFLNIGNYDEDAPVPGAAARSPGYKIDPRILTELGSFEQADFFVVMTEQADLSGAYVINDWSARGHYVYNRLLETAERTQAALRTELDGAGISYRPFLTNNSLLVYGGDMDLVNSIAARDEVAYLMANGSVELVLPEVETTQQPLEPLTWGVLAVNADDVWTNHGTTGAGIVVANIDTGVEWTHPALDDQYRGGPGDHDYNWYMPTSGCPGQTEPCDNNGHGTHTMGTIVGSTDPADPVNATEGIGVAPGAQWIACKGCETNSCSFEALLSCGDWMVAPTDLNGQNADPDMRPHVVNNSWGGGGGDFWYGGVVGAWRASGIFPQFSAGNSGPGCGTTGSPGDYDRSFGAAALQDLGGGNYGAANFSSRGPAAVTGLLQPNISAPGVAVRSSLPGGGYGNLNGTSMASPHVAGAVALVWSFQPELIGQIENTMWLLSQTAGPLFTTDGCGGDDNMSLPNHTYGWGIVDVEAAVVASDGLVIPWLDVIPGGVVVPPGDSVTIQLVITAPMQEGVYSGTLHLTADEPYNPDVRIPITINVIDEWLTYMPIILKQP